MNQKININRNIKIFYLLVFMFELGRSSFYGISSLFMLNYLKLAIYQISLIKMFSPITMAIFEIPSGVLGDRYGRKAIFITSSIFCALGFLIYAYSTTFWHAVLGEVFYSIGLAFHTGSIDALLISQANDSSEKISISNMLSKSSFFRTTGLLIGGSTGILLSFLNMSYSWLFGAFCMMLTIGLSTLLEGNYGEKKKISFDKSLISSYFKKREILSYTLLFSGIAVINVPFFTYWQIFMSNDLGISRRSMSFVFIYILYNFLMSMGSISLIYIRKVFKNRTLILSSHLVAITTIIMVILSNKYLALLIFLLSEFARGVQFPSFMFNFNKVVPEEHRSTYNSMLSFVIRIVTILSYAISGFLAKTNSNVKANILYMSLFGLLLIFLSSLVNKKREAN